MNYIWGILIIVSVIFSIITGRLDEFTKSLFDATKSAVEISLYLVGIIALWLGITRIIEDSGLIHRWVKFFQPAISRLFKNIPKDHPSITSITLNFLANLFGVGNAATPLGIKAMNDLQSLSEEKDVITFEMMLFIVINTSSIQLIPFSIIGLLAQYGSLSPSAIVAPVIISTIISSSIAISLLFLFKRFNKWN